MKNKHSVNYFSRWAKVEYGIPQGLILGPLSFLLYISDLPYTINDLSKPILFADDTSIIFTNHTLPT
jgi:hypothetical protein